MDQDEPRLPSTEEMQESDPRTLKETEKADRERAKQEAEEAKQRAKREAIEAKEKAKQEAEEAKEQAKREAEEAKQQAAEAREKAKQEAEEAKEQAKREAEEAKQAREAEKKAKKEEISKGKVISADNPELFSGSTTLFINQGAQGSKITYLAQSLSADKNIKVLSSGGALGKNSWISLSIENSTPLFKTLYQIPVIQTITRKSDLILLTLTEGELTRKKDE